MTIYRTFNHFSLIRPSNCPWNAHRRSNIAHLSDRSRKHHFPHRHRHHPHLPSSTQSFRLHWLLFDLHWNCHHRHCFLPRSSLPQSSHLQCLLCVWKWSVVFLLLTPLFFILHCRWRRDLWLSIYRGTFESIYYFFSCSKLHGASVNHLR
jgi:hypothetical protein